VCVGQGRCKKIKLTFVHGHIIVENYVVVGVNLIFEKFWKHKLFCPHPFAKLFEECVGLECFWPFKDVSRTSTHGSVIKEVGIYMDLH
jgi:hypothetical protein